MKRIKVKPDNEKKVNKKLLGIIIAATAAVFLISIALIVIESLMAGKISIKNDTDKNIESISVYFANDDASISTENIISGSVNQGETLDGKFDELDMSGQEMMIFFNVKFEGEDELYIYDGYFNGKYHGKIDISFTKQDDDYFMHAKAGYGITNSSELTDVDTDFLIDFAEKDWDYYYD